MPRPPLPFRFASQSLRIARMIAAHQARAAPALSGLDLVDYLDHLFAQIEELENANAELHARLAAASKPAIGARGVALLEAPPDETRAARRRRESINARRVSCPKCDAAAGAPCPLKTQALFPPRRDTFFDDDVTSFRGADGAPYDAQNDHPERYARARSLLGGGR